MTDYFDLHLSREEQLSLSALGMAHLGDGVYELMVRSWLILQGFGKKGNLHRETVARVTVYQDSLKMVFRVGEKSLQIWYATSGKGVYYRTDIRRWEEKKRPEK